MKTSILIPVISLLWASIGLSQTNEDPVNPPQGSYGEAHQFVFFAVLEGCYRDGLNDEEIDQIIPLHGNSS